VGAAKTTGEAIKRAFIRPYRRTPLRGLYAAWVLSPGVDLLVDYMSNYRPADCFYRRD
jgi:hypothetical protein